jgi:nicotinamidase/pyrazinamidase
MQKEIQKEALLVLDMLNDFVLPGAPLEVPETRNVMGTIQQEISRARAAGKLVVYVCDSHAPDDKEFRKFNWAAHAVTGTKGAEIVAELRPGPKDIVIVKDTYSAFYNSRLDEVLKSHGITALRLTGCVTHICVLFTTADAVLRDYAVTVVEDGVAGLDRQDHEAGLRIMKNVLGATMEKSRKAERKAA